MRNREESWLDFLTRKDMIEYMKKIGIEKIDEAKIVDQPNFGKYAYMAGITKDNSLYVEARGEFSKLEFGRARPVESFSFDFSKTNGKLQLTDRACCWIETVAKANEGRMIADENGVEHNYLDSFLYSFLAKEGSGIEQKIADLEKMYNEEKNSVADLYVKLNKEFDESQAENGESIGPVEDK